ncbi:RNA-binding KH domain-containing protein PEPPER-like [Coffea arabica]|uniref:RNA-binding KH domain-containing protein PEPPER-like n=1 Tax=Coffea arabica TaxID=13443 RepID=A0A6P6SQC9_COFAR|nr:RNA-binding KH domain-containing protein PEPPER-like [Coffea arabica]
MASTEATENGSAKSTEVATEATVNSQSEPAPEPEATNKAEQEAKGEAENEAAAEGTAEEAAQEEEEVEEETEAKESDNNVNKWPGWPGDCVFRLVVPVLKVGSIIGRKGELIKKMCEETRARIRVLDGPISSPERIVLISGKEEPDAPLSPAMDAVIRVFKRISGLPEAEGDGKAPGAAFCSIRLLVASTQAINLIGKQGSLIKSIQEGTGASVRVLSNDETPVYVSSDERIVDLQGETLKVLKALEAVVAHLRKFLVDHSVLPLFEKSYNAPVTQERPVESWSEKPLLHGSSQSGIGVDYTLPPNRDSLYFDRESHLEPQVPSSLSLYGQDPALSGVRPSGVGRATRQFVTTVAQTMRIPLDYAEDIIGIQGTNIAYIRRTSGAILTVQESRGLPDEITVEIKGDATQVQTAQQLIQEFISGHGHKESVSSSYGKLDSGLRPSYSQMGNSSYQSSSYSGQPYGSYGSSGLGGGYSSYRL